MNHIIHCMRWEVYFNGENPALAIDHELSQITTGQRFLNQANKSLDEVYPKNKIVFIDKLILDLGKLPAENWQKELENKLLEALKQKLIEARTDAKTVTLNQKEFALKGLVAYLKTGNLPTQLQKQQQTQETFFNRVSNIAKANNISVFQLILPLLQSDKALLTALTKWPLKVLFALFFKGDAIKEAAADKWLKLKKHPKLKSVKTKSFNTLVWLTFRQEKPTEPLTAEKVLEQLTNLQIENKRIKKVEKTNQSDQEKKTLKWMSELKNQENENLETKAHPKNPIQTKHNDEKHTQELYVQNSGIILVYPFLERLFNTLNIAKNKEIIDYEKALRVLMTLNYGQPKNQLEDFVLYKVLLGVPMNKILIPSKILSEEDVLICNNLLATLIDLWDVLKKTSPEGLREAFFNREGILKNTGKGYDLMVETNSIDVLLSQLPWPLGVIKLPWMPKPLYVNWG